MPFSQFNILDTFFYSIPISLNLKFVVRNDSRPSPVVPVTPRSLLLVPLGLVKNRPVHNNLVVMIFSSCWLLLCV